MYTGGGFLAASVKWFYFHVAVISNDARVPEKGSRTRSWPRRRRSARGDGRRTRTPPRRTAAQGAGRVRRRWIRHRPSRRGRRPRRGCDAGPMTMLPAHDDHRSREASTSAPAAAAAAAAAARTTPTGLGAAAGRPHPSCVAPPAQRRHRGSSSSTRATGVDGPPCLARARRDAEEVLAAIRGGEQVGRAARRRRSSRRRGVGTRRITTVRRRSRGAGMTGPSTGRARRGSRVGTSARGGKEWGGGDVARKMGRRRRGRDTGSKSLEAAGEAGEAGAISIEARERTDEAAVRGAAVAGSRILHRAAREASARSARGWL